VPFPIRPPRKLLNSGRIIASNPPDGESTRPVRTSTTRAPASAAGAVAASQSRQTSARNPLPDGADSSVTWPSVSP
jgi:hypothetical protein